jgi:hypothetical protein
VPGIEEAIAELLAAPLKAFVAERKRLAAELRAAGDREGAAELAKYPKPSAPAWALNDVARTQPGAIGAWLDAAEALRAATAAPGPGLRDAMAAHRRETSALLDVVRRTARPNGKPLTGPMLERVRALLAEATADPAAADALRSATLSEGARKGTAPVLARSSDAPEPDEPARDDAAERAAAEARAELERQVGAAYAAVSAANEELAERKAAASAAAERLEEAQRTLHRRESEARAAEDAARDARDAVTEAEDAAKALVEQLRRAG